MAGPFLPGSIPDVVKIFQLKTIKTWVIRLNSQYDIIEHKGKVMLRNTCANRILVTNRLSITDFWRGHDTTSDKKCTETQMILVYLYASKKSYNLSFAWYVKKYCRPIGNITVSGARECGAKCPRYEPRALPLLFGQNRGTCGSCEWIETKKSEYCNITLAWANVKNTSNNKKLIMNHKKLGPLKKAQLPPSRYDFKFFKDKGRDGSEYGLILKLLYQILIHNLHIFNNIRNTAFCMLETTSIPFVYSSVKAQKMSKKFTIASDRIFEQ